MRASLGASAWNSKLPDHAPSEIPEPILLLNDEDDCQSGSVRFSFLNDENAFATGSGISQTNKKNTIKQATDQDNKSDEELLLVYQECRRFIRT
jgi:hypothetical protein